MLVFLCLLLFANIYIANADYTLTLEDKVLTQKIEAKLVTIIESNSKYTYEAIISFLEKSINNATNERTKKMFEMIVSDFNKKINTTTTATTTPPTTTTNTNTGTTTSTTSNNTETNKVTILAWWNIFEIDNYLVSRWLIAKWDYVSYVESAENISKLSESFSFIYTQKTLEWYLYPDTYEINSWDFKISDLVKKQLENFDAKIYKKLFVYEDWTPKYMNEIIESVINLASIVEKEEKNLQEKPVVAWILKRAVRNYQKLWVDITVCYPHRLTEAECKAKVSEYLNSESEYNTHFITRLPPTPISNPSYETVNATLNHKETDYYYYLHDASWKVYYAKTLEEHEKNKELYLK